MSMARGKPWSWRRKQLPDDTKLNKLLADLSGRSADFVSALNKARDAEAKKELGYSLTWYVNAQNAIIRRARSRTKESTASAR